MDKSSKRTTVTSALPLRKWSGSYWPLGRVFYVPADIYVRYLRLKKQDVLFIGGSDETRSTHTIRAKRRNHPSRRS